MVPCAGVTGYTITMPNSGSSAHKEKSGMLGATVILSGLNLASILDLGPFLCLGLAAANSYPRHHQRHHHLNLFITCLVSA